MWRERDLSVIPDEVRKPLERRILYLQLLIAGATLWLVYLNARYDLFSSVITDWVMTGYFLPTIILIPYLRLLLATERAHAERIGEDNHEIRTVWQGLRHRYARKQAISRSQGRRFLTLTSAGVGVLIALASVASVQIIGSIVAAVQEAIETNVVRVPPADPPPSEPPPQ